MDYLLAGAAYIGQFALIAYLYRYSPYIGWWLLVAGLWPLVALWVAMRIEEWFQGY